ncbi:MAG: Gldg family protein [bacterium]
MKILAIFKKEFYSYLNTTTGYIILFLFALISNWLFMKPFFLINEASMRLFFELIPWFFLFFIPAITMGLFSSEKSLGTIEILFTLPIKDRELVFGKFLGSWAFVGFLLLFTLPIPIAIFFVGSPDIGPLIGGYISSLLLAGVYISIGIFFSSLSGSLILSYVLSIVFSFILLILSENFVLTGIPDFLVPIFRSLSLGARFDSVGRGIIDSRDIIYYTSIIMLFLYLTTKICENMRKRLSKAILPASLFLTILILLNLAFSYLFVRLDMTEERLYSLSSSTKKILKKIDSPLEINCYFSKNLPPNLSGIRMAVEDILKEYRVYGNGNVKFLFVEPEKEEIEQRLKLLGIPQVGLSVIQKDKIETIGVYLGIDISYKNRHQIIPFVEKPDLLEYDITSLILKLSKTRQKSIGFLGKTENFQIIKDLLKREYFIFPASTSSLNVDTLIILNENPQREVMEFVKGGGGLFLLINPIKIDGFTAIKEGLFDLRPYGINIKSDLVLDPSCSYASFNTGQYVFTTPYLFWTKIESDGFNKKSPIVSNIESLVFPWTSSIEAKNADVLISSSKYSWSQEAYFDLNPQQRFIPKIKKSFPLAVSFSYGKGRVVVVGNSRFIEDRFLSQFINNHIFFMNTVDWISFKDELIGIRGKGKTERPLKALSSSGKAFVKNLVVFLSPLIAIILGIIRLCMPRLP